MELILLDDMPKLGNMGDVVRVKDGYARNYLIPQGKAVIATAQNERRLEHERRIVLHKSKKMLVGAKDTAGRLDGVSVTVTRKVGDQDKLYGSVTTHDVQKALTDAGLTVDRRRILIDDPLRKLGVYKVKVKLHAEVSSTIKVWIVAE